jgi:hypothetical protein
MEKLSDAGYARKGNEANLLLLNPVTLLLQQRQ